MRRAGASDSGFFDFVEFMRSLAEDAIDSNYVYRRKMGIYGFVSDVSDHVSLIREVELKGLRKAIPQTIGNYIDWYLVGRRIGDSMSLEFLEKIYDAVIGLITSYGSSSISNLPKVIRELYPYKIAITGEDNGRFTEGDVIKIVNCIDHVPPKYYRGDYRRGINRIIKFYAYSFLGKLFFLMHDMLIIRGTGDLIRLVDRYRKPYGEHNLYLSLYILDTLMARRHDVSKTGRVISIEGTIGQGKSTYVFNSIANVVAILNPNISKSELEAMVSKAFVKDLETLMQIVGELDGRDVDIPIMILDDISDWLDPYWAWDPEKRGLFLSLRKKIVNLRGYIGVLVTISNGKDDIASFIRRLIEVRMVSRANEFYKPYFYTIFERILSNRQTLSVDAFVFPIFKLPDELYIRDIEHKRRAYLEGGPSERPQAH